MILIVIGIRKLKQIFFSNIDEKYDYILANPHYVAKSRIDEAVVML
jgi:methylase of polypeptide subunit release factors